LKPQWIFSSFKPSTAITRGISFSLFSSLCVHILLFWWNKGFLLVHESSLLVRKKVESCYMSISRCWSN
jgi:hypothetical protein